jgi:hypothetical protein
MCGAQNVQGRIVSGSLNTLPVYEWALKRLISIDVLRSAGVRYSSGTNSVLYERKNSEGYVLGYKVRSLDGKHQYNWPSGIPLRDTVPFMAQQGEDKTLVICEGESDALCFATNMVSMGDATVIGVPGASAFPNEWAGLLAGYDELFIVPDGDEAGRNFARRVCTMLPRTKVVRLDDGLDLSDAMIGRGLEYVEQCVANAKPMIIRDKIRTPSIQFKPVIGVDKSMLITFVLRDTRLIRRGKELVGLCPFHDEKTPSFMVDPKKNLYYCHGCGEGGDVVAYLRKRNGLSYKEAIRVIKDAGS